MNATAAPGRNRIYIATLTREQGDTGVQAHFNAFAHYLRALGEPVEVVTPYGNDRWVFYPLFALRFLLERLHRPTSVRWYRYTRLLALRFRLGRRLAGAGGAIVYAQCPVSAEAGLLARRSSDQLVAMVVHFNVSQADEWVGQGLLRTGDRAWRSIRAFEQRVLPLLDGIVFVSSFMRDLVLARIPAMASVKFEVIPNFVKAPATSRPDDEGAANRISLISVGTLESRKNQKYALDVLAAARRHCPGLVLALALVGDGPDRSMLERYATQLDLTGEVKFLGKVAGAARLLPSYDAYLHTAKIENLPIALIEAMSCGLPVFACPVGGIPELFDDGQAGVYLPLDNAEQAGRLLGESLRDAATRRRMGHAALAHFGQCFDEAIVAKRLLTFLKALTHGTASLDPLGKGGTASVVP